MTTWHPLRVGALVSIGRLRTERISLNLRGQSLQDLLGGEWTVLDAGSEVDTL